MPSASPTPPPISGVTSTSATTARCAATRWRRCPTIAGSAIDAADTTVGAAEAEVAAARTRMAESDATIADYRARLDLRATERAEVAGRLAADRPLVGRRRGRAGGRRTR